MKKCVNNCLITGFMNRLVNDLYVKHQGQIPQTITHGRLCHQSYYSLKDWSNMKMVKLLSYRVTYFFKPNVIKAYGIL